MELLSLSTNIVYNFRKTRLVQSSKQIIRCCFLVLSFSILIGFQVFSQQGIFIDVTEELGIDFSYGEGIEYAYGLISFNGGFSFIDINDDGLDDLAFGSADGDTLYVYLYEDGSYTPLPSGSMFSEMGISSCLYWVDYDNDGDKDLYVGRIDSYNKLYRNDGDGQFTDVTFDSGILAGITYTYSATWADFDNDGWLDLYFVNRDMGNVAVGLPPNSPNYMFRNNGDGTFENVTEEAGVRDHPGLGYGVVSVDYNNDGWPDIYVGNDKDTCNRLFKNNGDGTFEDVSDPNTTGRCISAMGISLADFDLNGHMDMYVTNGPGGNLLLQNNGDETFNEIGTELGVSVNHNGWGTIWEDFDNDGDEDIFAVDGGINLDAWLRNSLFLNQGDGTFVEDVTDSITLNMYQSYGATAGDWNDDGYVDIAVMNVGGDPAKFFQNRGGTNNWFKVRLQGVASNRDAIGTWIEVWCNGQKYIKYTTCGDSFASQSSNDYIFGLAQHEQVDSLILRWPSGVINNYYDLAVNQKMTFVEDLENSTGACLISYYPDTDSDGYGDASAEASLACQAPEGFVANNFDCDDTEMSIYPDAPELCDGLDNNCDGLTDEEIPIYTYYLDSDNDGFGDPLMALDTCLAEPLAGYVANDQDCDISNSSIYPDAPELCDGLDNDCNGLVDDEIPIYTYYLDTDNDGYGDPLVAVDTCLAEPLAGYVANDLDCDVSNSSVYPDAPELCDGLDNNCNGLVDDEIPVYTYYLDADGDGFGDALMALDTCLSTPLSGYVDNDGDCDDEAAEVNPDAMEIANNEVDEDCDGEVLIVGIEELGDQYYLNIMPNPVVDDLNIKHSLPFEAQMHLINNLNEVVMSFQLPSVEGTQIISVSDLPAGVYYVVISSTESAFRHAEPIVKTR